MAGEKLFQFYLCFCQAVYSLFSKTNLNLIDDLVMPYEWDSVQPLTYYFQQQEEPIKISSGIHCEAVSVLKSPFQLVKAAGLNKFSEENQS